jgi:hypothetical protein
LNTWRTSITSLAHALEAARIEADGARDVPALRAHVPLLQLAVRNERLMWITAFAIGGLRILGAGALSAGSGPGPSARTPRLGDFYLLM